MSVIAPFLLCLLCALVEKTSAVTNSTMQGDQTVHVLRQIQHILCYVQSQFIARCHVIAKFIYI